ncbi:hypothetical protein BLNAU_5835 [Blattamonas nauphoetae]|uniref:Uncharacterized protein n=1 Tax=Blattamonas nauphoetae TaxID=2049346 RepID=A0ABQ9Y683_9EUKA|nr:hypothetical protein BLNAU_5835 [Blattamonas nauphoetae]
MLLFVNALVIQVHGESDSQKHITFFHTSHTRSRLKPYQTNTETESKIAVTNMVSSQKDNIKDVAGGFTNDFCLKEGLGDVCPFMNIRTSNLPLDKFTEISSHSNFASHSFRQSLTFVEAPPLLPPYSALHYTQHIPRWIVLDTTIKCSTNNSFYHMNVVTTTNTKPSPKTSRFISPFLFNVHMPFPGVQRPANHLTVMMKVRESQGSDRRTEADVIDDNTVVHEMRSSSILLRVAGGYQWGEVITDTLRRSRQQRMDGLAGVERELERIKTTHFDGTSHARPPDRASSSPQTSRSFTRQTEPNFAQTLPAQFVPPLHLSTTSPDPDRPKQLTRPDSTRRAVMVMAALSLDDIAPGAKSVHPPKANTNRSPVEPEPKQDTPQPTKPVEAPTPSLPRVNTDDWLSLGNETPSMHQHTNSDTHFDTHFDTSFTSDLSTDPLMRRRTLDAGTGEESEERPAEPHSDSEEIPSLLSQSEQHSPPAPQRTVSHVVLDPDSQPHSPDLTIERAAQIVKDFEFKGIQSLARPLSSLVRPVSAETRTSSIELADDNQNAESDPRQEASTPERQRRADEESRRSADRKNRLDRLRASGEEISAAQQARFKSHEHSGVFSKLKHAMDLVEDEKRARKERRERLLSIGRNASKSPASRGTRKGHKRTPKKRQLTKTTPLPSPRPDDTQFLRSLRPLNKFLFDFHVDPPYDPNSAVHTDDKQTRTIPQQTQPGIVSLHAPCPIGHDAADHTVEEIDRNYPPSSAVFAFGPPTSVLPSVIPEQASEQVCNSRLSGHCPQTPTPPRRHSIVHHDELECSASSETHLDAALNRTQSDQHLSPHLTDTLLSHTGTHTLHSSDISQNQAVTYTPDRDEMSVEGADWQEKRSGRLRRMEE